MTQEELIESELNLIKSSKGDPDCWTYDWVSTAKLRAGLYFYRDLKEPPSDPVKIVRDRFQGLLAELNNNPERDDFFTVNCLMEMAEVWLACYYAFADGTIPIESRRVGLCAGANPEDWLQLAETINILAQENIDEITKSSEVRSGIICHLDYIGLLFHTFRPGFLSDAVFYAVTDKCYLDSLADAAARKVVI